MTETIPVVPVWKKVLNWYKKLPWWGKILGFVALIGVALLFVSQLWSPGFGGGGAKSPRADKAQENNIEVANNTYDATKTRLEKELQTKKMIEITLINQSGVINKKSVAMREKINNAKSIEEIDAILKTVR